MALSGKRVEDIKELNKEEIQEQTTYSQKEENNHFTIEQIIELWPSFIERFKQKVHLYNTLQSKPQLIENNVVRIEVANSVQDEAVRLAKPEIIGYLRRTLHNSSIEVEIVVNKAKNDRKILTDEQKLQDMMKKNPALIHFKNKFLLDFNN